MFPSRVQLAGIVHGGTPLSFWTADGNGYYENYLVKYHEQIGLTSAGPLRIASGGNFGYPTDFVRVGATVYGIDGLRRMLYTLDGQTGIVTPIGTAWPALFRGVESLAYDAAGDRLFAVDRASRQLLRIHRGTGTLTPVGAATLAAYPEVRSLAWNPGNSRLYAVDQSTRTLLSIDPATGVPSIVSIMAPESHARIEELEFVGDRLYGIQAIDNGTSLVSAQLQRISPDSGATQNLGPRLSPVSALCLLLNSIPEDRVWSKVSGPGTVVFSDPYALNPTVTFSRGGTYVLKFRVNTGSGPAFDTVTITLNEWTPFTPSGDTRVIYVSSSTGNDAWNGLSPSTPKRTIEAGKVLMRNGLPDWLLLRKGDVWDSRLGDWWYSGRSASERMLISSYGTAPERPLLRTGNASGFSAGRPVHHVAIVGIRFHCNQYNGATWTRGIEFLDASTNLLIEDCVTEGFNNGIVVTASSAPPRHFNVTIRRNVVIDSYDTQTNGGNGIFLGFANGVLIEENVIDNNGWTEAHYPHNSWPGHNIYAQNGNLNVVVRGNIISRTDGIQLRCGGLLERNLFLRNAISIMLGGGVQPENGGVTGIVRNNVVLDGANYDPRPHQARGWGMSIAGNVTSSIIESNVVAHNVNGSAPIPAVFSVANNGRGVENTLFMGNIFHAWNGSTQFQGSGPQTANFQLFNNKFQNQISADPLIVHSLPESTSAIFSAYNVFDGLAGQYGLMRVGGSYLSLGQWKPMVHDTTSLELQATFPAPGRTIATYHQSIGGAPSLDAFMSQARMQSRANWRVQYTAPAVIDFIRAGFALAPASYSL